MLLGERDVDTVVGGGGLQLEIESTAEPLSQRQAPRLVDAPAEGRMDYQLHSSTFIEEPFSDDRGRGRNRAKHSTPGDDVCNKLLRSPATDCTFFHQPTNRRHDVGVCWRHVFRRNTFGTPENLVSQFAYTNRKN